MATLTIDLQDGFAGDTVVIRVDGKEVFRKAGVNTDYSIGRADSVTVEVGGAKATVDVAMPSRNLSGTETLDVGRTPFLGVSAADSRVAFRPSSELFRYF